MSRAFELQLPLKVTLWPAGSAPTEDQYKPGDFLLVHHNFFVSKMIRFGQRIRIHGDDRKYCYWNHAVLIVSDQGHTIEALAHGIERTNIRDYHGKNYALVHVDASDEDRQEIVKFANFVVGEKYGYLTILSIALNMLTGGKLVFSIENQLVCSGLVARAQERAGALFSRDPAHMAPADLAKYYDVKR